jgi:hypothetical protein
MSPHVSCTDSAMAMSAPRQQSQRRRPAHLAAPERASGHDQEARDQCHGLAPHNRLDLFHFAARNTLPKLLCVYICVMVHSPHAHESTGPSRRVEARLGRWPPYIIILDAYQLLWRWVATLDHVGERAVPARIPPLRGGGAGT